MKKLNIPKTVLVSKGIGFQDSIGITLSATLGSLANVAGMLMSTVPAAMFTDWCGVCHTCHDVY